jgi:hypothetical protein
MLKIESTCTLQELVEGLPSFQVLTSCLNLAYQQATNHIDGSFDFSGVLSKVTIEIGGRDINLAVGPMFDDVSVNVFYNVISTIIEQQITTVEEIVYLNLTDPTQIDLIEEIIEYNDIKIDDSGED